MRLSSSASADSSESSNSSSSSSSGSVTADGTDKAAKEMGKNLKFDIDLRKAAHAKEYHTKAKEITKESLTSQMNGNPFVNKHN